MTNHLPAPADCNQLEMCTLLHNISGHYRSRACRSVLHKCSTFPKQALVFTCLQYKLFKTLGKGEIAHNEQFLLPTVLSTL